MKINCRVKIKEKGNDVLRNLNNDCFNPFFSHIYVEKQIQEHPRTKQILAKYPKAEIIEINHYKDIFCRKGQSYMLQHHTQKLILAAKDGNMIYQGSPVCQSFGNDNFYYTSCMMNCIYDCEYCYLKGMYASANLVVFINIEDIFAEIEQILKNESLYLCVSYDTDLLALERIAGYADEWIRFAAKHPNNLKIEIRTKCAGKYLFDNKSLPSNVIYAFTLSPQVVIDQFEHHTPSLTDRIACAASLVRTGTSVRLCFDPMIYVPDWKSHYEEMISQVTASIRMEDLVDVSVGTFRISQDYLKKMRKQEPYSAAAWFPYQVENGFYHYPDTIMKQMEQYLVNCLKEHISEQKIFLWNSKESKTFAQRGQAKR